MYLLDPPLQACILSCSLFCVNYHIVTTSRNISYEKPLVFHYASYINERTFALQSLKNDKGKCKSVD